LLDEGLDMAGSTNALLVASAGVVSLTPGATVSFGVLWGSNISPFRWTRVWAAVESPGDEDSAQSVTLVSEGSAWNLSDPAVTENTMTLKGQGQSGAPVLARIQVLASQVDTF
jgi:hypothetical protein